MQQLTIQFEDGQFKCKPTPSTQLQTLVEQSREFFKLPKETQLKLRLYNNNSRKPNPPLDSSLTVRLANLSPSNKLELYQLEGDQAQQENGNFQIQVAVQDGASRQTDSISVTSSTSVWEILLHFQAKHNVAINHQSVAVVLGQELVGQQLQQTSMQRLGVQNGAKVLIRLSKRSSLLMTASNPQTTNVQSVERASGKLEAAVAKVDRPVATQSVEAQTIQLEVPSTASVNLQNRDVQVFTQGQNDVSAAQLNIPDSFYQLSAQELRQIVQSSSKKEDQPLLTKALRDRQLQQRQSKHPQTTIRLKFPSQLLVQGKFQSSETIQNVYLFARSLMKVDVKFYLYVTPPMKKLDDMEANLHQSGLVPAAVVNVGFPQSMQFVNEKIFIDSVLQNIQELPVHPSVSTWVPQPSDDQPHAEQEQQSSKVDEEPVVKHPPSGQFRNNHQPAETTSKVPKWFKMGNKK